MTATINAAGAFDNSASVSATEFDPNSSNNTDSSGNGGTAAASADVAITKTASLPNVIVGQTLDYTLVVQNNGPGTATGVTVTDPLPANFSLVSATPTQGSCSGTTTVTCTIGTMANGAIVTITLHGNVTAAGSLSNTATVTHSEADSVTSNDASTATASAVVFVPAMSELTLMFLALVLAVAGVMVMKKF